MIQARSVSPYFRQYFILQSYSQNGYTSTNLGLGLGVGVEFMRNSHISPFVEGNFTYSTVELYNSVDFTGFAFRGGVRLSWKK